MKPRKYNIILYFVDSDGDVNTRLSVLVSLQELITLDYQCLIVSLQATYNTRLSVLVSLHATYNNNNIP